MRGRLVLPALALTMAVAAAGSGRASSVAASTTATVSGRVTSSTTGLGLPGSVQFLDVNTHSTFTAQLDGAGNYSISLQSADYRVLTQNTDGYINELYGGTPCSVACDTSGATIHVLSTDIPNVDFILDPGGLISGTVTNARTGLPIPNVTVAFFGSDLVTFTIAKTDANGNYLSDGGTATGTVYARTSNSLGYFDQLFHVFACGLFGCPNVPGTSIAVTIGATTTGIDFALTNPGFSGTVTDKNGVGLAGVSVVAHESSEFITIGQATTDGAGHYEIEPQQYSPDFVVTAHKDGYYDQVYDGLACVFPCNAQTAGTQPVIPNSGTLTNIDFSLVLTSETGSISGTGGSTVEALTASGKVVGRATFSGGVYTIAGLTGGTSYYVRTRGGINQVYSGVTCVGICGPPFVGATPVAVVAGSTTSNINFSSGPGPTGAISGNASGISNGFFHSLGFAVVELYSSTGQFLKNTIANSSGNYALSGLATGTYYLRAAADTDGVVAELYGGTVCVSSCDVTTGTAVAVTDGVNHSGINFNLDTAGGLTGNVRSNLAAPLASGVAIYSRDGVLVKTATANASGDYVISGLPAGTYYARTTNTLGYRDAVFDGHTFCDPSCAVTDGTPIPVFTSVSTTHVDFVLAPGAEALQNSGFSSGTTNWSLYATPDPSYIVSQLVDGVFVYYRASPPPQTSNEAVILQDTTVPVGAGDPVLVQFDLGNTSDVRKRISVLVHASDFSDLSVCTFWLAPHSPPRRYGMLTHPTQAWTNSSISLYAASEGSQGGYYQLDNVTMQTLGNVDISETQCLDPALLASAGGVSGPELLVNGNFSTGDTQGWTTFGELTWQVSAGVFEFIRPTSAPPAGVILQQTGTPAAAGDRLTAHFDLGNSSGVRKRVTVLLHDLNFNDLSACTFWLEPGQPLSSYTMQGYASVAWANTTISVYAATVDGAQWMRLDNVSLKKTPSSAITGTGCFEPGSTQPAGPAPGSSAMVGTAAVVAAPATTKTTTTAAQGDGSSSFDLSTDGVRTPWTMVDLTASGTAALTFESRLGAGTVEILIDGSEQQTLAAVAASDDWVETTLDLSAYTGHMLRVRFVIDPTILEDSVSRVWQIRNIVFIRQP